MASRSAASAPAGAGQLTKMVNQICIAGLVQGLSEALNFAMKAGLDGEQVVDAISGGAAGSWQMVNRHKTMLADHYEHGFAVNWMRKDLGIVPRRGAAERRPPAGHGAGRPVLRRGAGHGRRPLGHFVTDEAPATLTRQPVSRPA